MTDTPTNPAAVVEQVDIDAVASFHKQSFKALFETTDEEIDADINRAHALLCQAFARHRLLGIEQGRAEMREEADDLLAGAIAYEITKTYVMDVPTARAVIDRARRAIPTAKERG